MDNFEELDLNRFDLDLSWIDESDMIQYDSYELDTSTKSHLSLN